MEELTFGGDPLEAVILPAVGARIHRLRAFGHDLLRTSADPATHLADPHFWGAYPMAPWCNRIAPGAVTVEGRTVDLPPTFPDGSAIHGQVSTRPWAYSDGTLRISRNSDGWPWPFEVVAHIAVDGPTLALDYELVNRSDSAMPAGIGLHPWFRRPVELRVGASTVYASNSGSPAVAASVRDDLDLRSLGPPAPDLDGTWVSAGPASVDVVWPDIGLRATVEANVPCIAVATPSNLDAIAVEPQTHGPDGMRRLLSGEPDALALLAPGEALRLEVRLTVERVSLAR